jgi:hypothetical protein
MTKENLLKIITGANKVARKSAEILKDSGSNYIEEHIVKGKYVTREEYDQLHKLVLKLQKEIAELKSRK